MLFPEIKQMLNLNLIRRVAHPLLFSPYKTPDLDHQICFLASDPQLLSDPDTHLTT